MLFEDEFSGVSGQLALPQLFITPDHPWNCFSNIPSLIRELFGPKSDGLNLAHAMLGEGSLRPKKVVLFLVDSFGWSFYERWKAELPVLGELTRSAHVKKLTAQFPSTTSAHVTTLHTGLPPAESGIFEWYFYDPIVGEVISPLMYTLAGSKQRELLREMGFEPEELLPQGEHYRSLETLGVRSVVFLKSEYAGSSFTRVVTKGAALEPFRTLDSGLKRLSELLKMDGEREYYCFYYDDIDVASHVHGPNSKAVKRAVHRFFSALSRGFFRALEGCPDQIAVLLTADHGQTEVNPQTTVYLNRDCGSILPYLEGDKHGRLIAPCGSARDFFLHVCPEYEDEVIGILSAHLAERAMVVRTEQLIEGGLFGTRHPSERFRQRVGNVVVLPFRGESVWWYEEGRFKQKFYGHHGGLTPEELEIPLFFWRHKC